MNDDSHVYLIQLPTDVRGAVMLGEDGFYSIYINSCLPLEMQRKAYAHELRHIKRDDFRNGKPIREIEGD